MTEEQIRYMVHRFLWWKLPETFNPDCGISFKRTHSENGPLGPQKYEPVGTNLLGATEADAMVRHMIEGMPASPEPVVGALHAMQLVMIGGGARPLSNDEALRLVDVLSSAGYEIRPRVAEARDPDLCAMQHPSFQP